MKIVTIKKRVMLQSLVSIIVFLVTLNGEVSAGVISNAFVCKMAWYTQTNSKEVSLEPVQAYSFTTAAQTPKNLASSIISATITLPSGTLPMYKALSLGSDTGGVLYFPQFASKSDLDTLCPSNSKVVCTVNTTAGTETYTIQIQPDTYPPPPVISVKGGGAWSPMGYIVVTNPLVPLTISWPVVKNQYSSITIYGGNYFPGFSSNTSGGSFTLSPEVLSNFPSGILGAVDLNTGVNQSRCHNKFGIFIMPNLLASTPSVIFKQHKMIQTNDLEPIDYAPIIGSKSAYYNNNEYGPYSFIARSSTKTSLTKSNHLTNQLTISAQDQIYEFCSGGISYSQINSIYPNGNYKLGTGQSLLITGDVYPQAPKVISVNGVAPTWTNGFLKLSSSITNIITWTEFSGYAPFAQCGIEEINFSSMGYSDWGNLFSAAGAAYSNVLNCPVAGIDSYLTTSYTIPPLMLKTNVNYMMSITYGALTSSTNQPCVSGAGYTTETIIPIIAN